MKFASLALGAALSIAAPALAFAACERPSPPASVDGAAVTMDQLVAAKNGVTAFITASDDYQSCVLADLAAQQKAAKKGGPKLDPAVKKTADDSISGNQADKEKVGTDFNAAVKAYKAAHPS
jgi:Skp family chaperone for outer membrane proteins